MGRRLFKRGALWASKWSGLSRLSRRITGAKLRILAYHGFATDDEVVFRPGLFIRRETFRRRLQWLQRAGISVLGLTEALKRLANSTLPPAAVVITIDDGFESTYRIAANELARLALPATVYLTTYYVSKQTEMAPVSRTVRMLKVVGKGNVS